MSVSSVVLHFALVLPDRTLILVESFVDAFQDYPAEDILMYHIKIRYKKVK